jgi:hypothetical protein
MLRSAQSTLIAWFATPTIGTDPHWNWPKGPTNIAGSVPIEGLRKIIVTPGFRGKTECIAYVC